MSVCIDIRRLSTLDIQLCSMLQCSIPVNFSPVSCQLFISWQCPWMNIGNACAQEGTRRAALAVVQATVKCLEGAVEDTIHKALSARRYTTSPGRDMRQAGSSRCVQEILIHCVQTSSPSTCVLCYTCLHVEHFAAHGICRMREQMATAFSRNPRSRCNRYLSSISGPQYVSCFVPPTRIGAFWRFV